MKVKPAKCKSHAVKRVIPNSEQKRKDHKTQYTTCDHQLEIDGQQITYTHSQPMRLESCSVQI